MTAHGFKDASDDQAQIRGLFAPHPGCLVGVPTGEVSSIDILDIDPRHGGHLWLAENKHRLPATRVHETRSGGQHLLFAAHAKMRCSTGKIAPGIDVRAEGGYVIWWPVGGPAVPGLPSVRASCLAAMAVAAGPLAQKPGIP